MDGKGKHYPSTVRKVSYVREAILFLVGCGERGEFRREGKLWRCFETKGFWVSRREGLR